MIRLAFINLPEQKSEICGRILRSLPDWFGIESSVAEYVQDVRPLPFWAAMDGGEASVGFAALKRNNAFTAELFLIGVAQAYHRQGVGKRLVNQCVAYSRSQSMRFLTVKTLDESANSAPYDRTRAFYLSMGFLPLEVFPDLWDPHNPCLLMVKPL